MPHFTSRRDVLKLLSASAFSGVCGFPAMASASESLRFGGTGSATAMLNVLSLAFKHHHPAIEPAVVSALGSSGGIRAVSDAAIDIAVSARPLKPEESDVLTAVQFARSPYVIATSHPQPGPLPRAEIARMIADPHAKWHDGSPVRIILRPRNESDNALMARLFPGAADAIEAARKRSEVPIAVSDQDNATMAESVPGSFIGISLTQLQLEKRNLRPIPIDGVAASLTSLESGAYPFARDLHLIYSKTPTQRVERFVAFLRSPEGIKTLRDCGCRPLA